MRDILACNSCGYDEKGSKCTACGELFCDDCIRESTLVVRLCDDCDNCHQLKLQKLATNDGQVKKLYKLLCVERDEANVLGFYVSHWAAYEAQVKLERNYGKLYRIQTLEL